MLNTKPNKIVCSGFGCLLGLMRWPSWLSGSCATDTSKYLREGHKYADSGEWDNSRKVFSESP